MKDFILPFLLIVLSPFLLLAQEPYVEVVYEEIYDNGSTANNNALVGDFNQDGTIEVLFSTHISTHSYLKFLQSDGNSYSEKILKIFSNSNIVWLEYDDSENIIYIAEKQRLISFDPMTDEIKIIFDEVSNMGINKFYVHKDGGKNYFLLRSANELILIDEQGEILKKDYFEEMKDFAIGNIDNESNIEIVISSSVNSKVLDFFTFEEEWVYFSKFGDDIVLGDADNDGIALIFGHTYEEVSCFDVQKKSQVWTKEFENYGLPSAYIEGNQQNEPLLLIPTQTGISALNPETGNQLWQIESPSFHNTSMIMHDLNGDEGIDLFYVSFSKQVIRDMEASTQWVSQDKGQGMNIDIINNKNEGVIDYVTCSGTSGDYSNNPILEVHDGSTDMITKGPYKFENLSTIQELAVFKRGNSTYYLLKDDLGKINVYQNSFSSIYAQLDEYNLDISDIELMQFENVGKLYLVGINKKKQFVVYSIKTGKIEFVWETPKTSQDCISFIIENLDDDESLEVAILYPSAIVVYDLTTNLLEKQVFVEYNSDHDAFEIFDYDQDGDLDFIIGGKSTWGKTDIQVIDIETEEIQEVVISQYAQDLEIIKLVNLDLTESPEMIFITNKLYIFNTEKDSIIGKLDIDPVQFKYINNNDIEVVDLDHDNHMDILLAHTFGYKRMRVNTSLVDTSLPYVEKYNPSSNYKNLPTNISINVFFSEEIDLSSCENIQIVDEEGTIQKYDLDLSDSLSHLVILPQTTWSANQKLTITLPNSILDLNGNSLDGNYNGEADDSGDDYEFTIDIGNGKDEYSPYFVNLDITKSLLKGQQIVLSGMATDANDNAQSTIKQILYSINDKLVVQNGKIVPVLDGIYDACMESFSFKEKSDTFNIGNHTVYFKVQDAMNNWSDLDSLQFTILEETPHDWSVIGKDNFNTSHVPSSSFNYPFGLKHSIENESDNLSQTLVVGNNLIYSSKNYIYVKDFKTGNTIWKKKYSGADGISTPVYAYGNIYFQIDDITSQRLVCLSLTDGEQIWSTDYSVQGSDMAGPMIADGNVLMVEGYYDTEIAAYDAFNGNLKWKKTIAGYGSEFWTPAVYNGKIYGYSDNFSVIELATGVELINIKADDLPSIYGSFSPSPVIDTLNNQVILTNRNYVFALDLENYNTKWSISAIDYGTFTSTPSLAKNALYIGTKDRIMEVDASNGEVVWDNDKYSCEYDPVSSDSIVVFSSEDSFVMVDLDTKEVSSEFKRGGNLTLTGEYLILSEKNGSKVNILERKKQGVNLTANLIVLDSISCHGKNDASISVFVEGGTGDVTFKWDDISSNTSIRNSLSPGKYSVTIADDALYNVEHSVIVPEPSVLELEANSTDEVNGNSNGSATVVVSGGKSPYFYFWEDFPGLSTHSIINLVAGNYDVEVVDANGCSQTVTIVVNAITSTYNPSKEYKIHLFPNASNGEFKVQIPYELVGSRYVIVDQAGSVMKQGEMLSQESHFSLKLANGMYYLTLIKNHTKSTVRFAVIN